MGNFLKLDNLTNGNDSTITKYLFCVCSSADVNEWAKYRFPNVNGSPVQFLCAVNVDDLLWSKYGG